MISESLYHNSAHYSSNICFYTFYLLLIHLSLKKRIADNDWVVDCVGWKKNKDRICNAVKETDDNKWKKGVLLSQE